MRSRSVHWNRVAWESNENTLDSFPWEWEQWIKNYGNGMRMIEIGLGIPSPDGTFIT